MARGQYMILLTEQEAALIRNKAKEKGLAFGAYVRETMMEVLKDGN